MAFSYTYQAEQVAAVYVSKSGTWSMDEKEEVDFIRSFVNRGKTQEPEENENMTKEELVKKINFLSEENKDKDVEIEIFRELFKKAATQLDLIESRDKVENDLYGRVVDECNVLKQQLLKAASDGVFLKRLSEYEANKLKTEATKPSRQMQRFGYGLKDDEVPEDKNESNCLQCHKYVNELQQSENLLNKEIKENTEMKLEMNFLRKLFKVENLTESELILYKATYKKASHIVMDPEIPATSNCKIENCDCRSDKSERISNISNLSQYQSSCDLASDSSDSSSSAQWSTDSIQEASEMLTNIFGTSP